MHTTIEEKIGSFQNIVILEFFAAGIVYLAENFVEFLLSSSNGNPFSYDGFDHKWYLNVGYRISFNIFLSAFITNFKEFQMIALRLYARFKDRGYKIHLKKDIEIDVDD